MSKFSLADSDDNLLDFSHFDDASEDDDDFALDAPELENEIEHPQSHGRHGGSDDLVPTSHGNDDLLFVNDVHVLKDVSFAKGGNGGGGGKGGGGKGGGGGSEPGVLDKYISGGDAATSYNIEINFKGTWTVDLQEEFIVSADLLSTIIQGDIGDVFFRGKTIDDIKIDATLKEIDGEGGILGQAGATSVRTANYLPATAIMEFDIADAATFDTAGLWDEIVLHEMIHSIGFSANIWSNQGLISGAGTDTPLFTGDNAILTYESLFSVINAAGVPLEQDGGAGTRDSHWDEETFGAELMTGYINTSGNFLSDITIAALEDMGYDTTWTADPYSVV